VLRSGPLPARRRGGGFQRLDPGLCGDEAGFGLFEPPLHPAHLDKKRHDPDRDRQHQKDGKDG